MMVGKMFVDFGVEQVVFVWQLCGEQFECWIGGVVVGVLIDVQIGEFGGVEFGQFLQQVIDIGLEDFVCFVGVVFFGLFVVCCQLVEFLDVCVKEWLVLEYYFEVIVIGGIMVVGYLDVVIYVFG